MPKALRIFLTGLSFVAFSVIGGLISYWFLPLATLGARNEVDKLHRAQRALHRGARIYLGSLERLGLIQRHEPARMPDVVEAGQPAVIVANHPTLLDILLVLAVTPRATFLAKSSWFRNPLIAPILRYTGAIPGPSSPTSSPIDGALVLETMIERLQQGLSVVIFPEGTRSPAGGLRRFQKGAFEAALRAHVPVVALMLYSDPPTLLKDQSWHDVPERRVHLHLEIMAVVAPEHAPSSARRFCRELRSRYEQSLGLAPAPSPQRDPAAAAHSEIAAV